MSRSSLVSPSCQSFCPHGFSAGAGNRTIVFEKSLIKIFFIGEVVAQAMVTTPYSLITIRLVTLEAPYADSLHVFFPRNKC